MYIYKKKRVFELIIFITKIYYDDLIGGGTLYVHKILIKIE